MRSAARICKAGKAQTVAARLVRARPVQAWQGRLEQQIASGNWRVGKAVKGVARPGLAWSVDARQAWKGRS